MLPPLQCSRFVLFALVSEVVACVVEMVQSLCPDLVVSDESWPAGRRHWLGLSRLCVKTRSRAASIRASRPLYSFVVLLLAEAFLLSTRRSRAELTSPRARFYIFAFLDQNTLGFYLTCVSRLMMSSLVFGSETMEYPWWRKEPVCAILPHLWWLLVDAAKAVRWLWRRRR